jgi:hypothetical protein
VHYSLLRPTALQRAGLPHGRQRFRVLPLCYAPPRELRRGVVFHPVQPLGGLDYSNSNRAVRDFLSGSATTSDRASAPSSVRASIVSREDRNVRKKASNERPRNVQRTKDKGHGRRCSRRKVVFHQNGGSYEVHLGTPLVPSSSHATLCRVSIGRRLQYDLDWGRERDQHCRRTKPQPLPTKVDET